MGRLVTAHRHASQQHGLIRCQIRMARHNRLRITCQASGLMNLRTKDDISDIMRRYSGTTLPERPTALPAVVSGGAVWLDLMRVC